MSSPTSNSVGTTKVGTSGLGDVAALIAGRKWGGGSGSGVNLTYSFLSGSTFYASGYGDYAFTAQDGFSGAGEFAAFDGLTAAEKTAVERGLGQWSSVADIDFAEVTDGANVVGDLRFGMTDIGNVGTAAHAYFPSSLPEGGDVWFLNGVWHTAGGAIQPGSYDYLTILHEIGHALGLKHPFSGANTLPEVFDNYSFTVMSYSAYAGGNGDNDANFYPTTPMWFDLLAIQFLYGDRKHNHGNTTYAYAADARYWETIDDSGGKDTIVATGAQAATIDLRIGKWSNLGQSIFFTNAPQQSDTVMIGPRSAIENARGGDGIDVIVGNGLANRLRGGGAGDTLRGNGGDDTLNGETGFDTLVGGKGRDHFAFKVAPLFDFDTIADFKPADDTIDLDGDVYAGLGGAGPLAASRFRIGAAAADGSDRILYDPGTGALRYDPDGDGGGVAILFAQLDAGLAVTRADFLVI